MIVRLIRYCNNWVMTVTFIALYHFSCLVAAF